MNITDYPPLALPAAGLRIEPASGSGRPKVFDPRRNRWVTLTPEEWVRQHFVEMLVNEKGYFPGNIANEIAITLNDTSRRCDTVVFDRFKRPLIIVEYKAPSVAITQRVFDQIVRYNMVLRADYLIVSNGLQHFCCHIDYGNMTYAFLQDIPSRAEVEDGQNS